MPTYVYPREIRQEVRQRFPDDRAGAKDDEYDEKEDKYVVTWDDTRQAKWPKPPKSCQVCQPSRGKPY